MRRTVLPGGLRVLTEAIPSSHTFSIGVFVGVGSRQESAELHGASHFLEHVLFKGTRRRSAEEISAAIECLGGELNAHTAKEYTCFYARVQGADAEVAVDVLVDMITDSQITTADVDGERAVILDEIAMHADEPGEVAEELVAEHVFAGSGLARPVIGSEASVADLSVDAIRRHWRQHYSAAGLVVAVAGQVDHDRLVDWLLPLDGRPVGPAPQPGPATRLADQGALVSRRRGVEQINAMLAYPGVGVFDGRRYPLGLLSVILGGGMASRLFVEVRERRALTYGIDAGETAYLDAGLWSVDWQCGPDRLAAILDVVSGVLHDVAEHGVTEAELARAQGQMHGQTVLSFEGPGSRMFRLGVNALLGDQRTLSEVLAGFDAVTADDVRAEAARLFGGPPVLSLVGPPVPPRAIRSFTTRAGIG